MAIANRGNDGNIAFHFHGSFIAADVVCVCFSSTILVVTYTSIDFVCVCVYVLLLVSLEFFISHFASSECYKTWASLRQRWRYTTTLMFMPVSDSCQPQIHIHRAQNAVVFLLFVPHTNSLGAAKFRCIFQTQHTRFKSSAAWSLWDGAMKSNCLNILRIWSADITYRIQTYASWVNALDSFISSTVCCPLCRKIYNSLRWWAHKIMPKTHKHTAENSFVDRAQRKKFVIRKNASRLKVENGNALGLHHN